MAIKNMGTATMRFKEGVKIEGDTHASANQLVVTGSISLMEPASGGSVTATLESSANPTTSETTPNDWEFISGGTNNASSTSYQPRFPIIKIPIDSGGYWEDEIYAFEGSGTGNMRLLSHKAALSGDHRLEFMLIGGGNVNSDSAQTYFAGKIKRPQYPSATGYPYTLEHPAFVWSSGSSDPIRDIKVMVATTGYGATDNWTQVGSVTYHAHLPNHPDSGTRNLNQHQFESFSVDITGISGNYYVALVQDGSSQYNTWAAADVNLYSLTSTPGESYINFEPQGTWYEGEDGIGFRNNAGVMEYKDEGATWRQFNTLAVGPASPDRSIQFNDNGDLGSGNFFYSSDAKVGIGDFSNDNPNYLLTVRGNKGDSVNTGINGYVAIEEHNDGTGPGLIFQRSRGELGTETDVQDDDLLGSISYIGRVSNNLQILAGTNAKYHSSIGTNMTFALKGSQDSGVSNKLFLRDVSLMPHDDTVTSNVGAFVLGADTNAFGTLYTENIRGPQGTDLKVLATNNDLIVHVGTQGTYANNVGIGNSEPQYPVDVSAHSGDANAMQLGSTEDTGPILRMFRTGGSYLAPADAGDGFGLFHMGVETTDLSGNKTQYTGATLEARALTTWSTAIMTPNQNSEWVFGVQKSVESNIYDLEVLTLNGYESVLASDLFVSGSIEVEGSITTPLDFVTGADVEIEGDLRANTWKMLTTNGGGRTGGSVSGSSLLMEYTEGVLNNWLTVNPSDVDFGFRVKDEDSNYVLAVKPSGKTTIGTDSGSAKYTDYSSNTLGSLSDGGLYVEGTSSDGVAMTIANTDEGTSGDGLAIICGYGSYQRQNWSNPIGYPSNQNGWVKMYGKKRSYALTSTEVIDDSPPDEIVLHGTLRGDGFGGVDADGITFTGSHDSVSTQAIEPGLIVESTGELWISHGMSMALPKIQMTSAEKSKTAYGVVESQEIRSGRSEMVPDGNTGYTINSVGEGKVWITNLVGEPTNGDYITSSPISGYGQLQDDDILHSYTVAKLTESIDWSNVNETIVHEGVTYKRYLAGCTYHCG